MSVRKSERAAALIEFSLVTPLLLVLIQGLINIGSFLTQIHAISNSVRVGTRHAASIVLMYDRTCDNLKAEALKAANEDFTANVPPPHNRWAARTVEIVDSGTVSDDPAVRGDSAVNPARRLIRIEAQAQNLDGSGANCIFCMGHFIESVLPKVDAVFMLPAGCDD